MGMKLLEAGSGFDRPLEGYSVRQAQIKMSLDKQAKVCVSAVLALSFVSIGFPSPASAQLPPVNMGRWVHQPGDNQYSTETQQGRHGGGPAPAAVAAPVNIPLATPGWRPTPKPRRDDISLLPVVCDEPVPASGFPPMPDGLDLPGLRGGSTFRGSGGGMGGGGGNFSSSYGGGGGGGGSVQLGQPGGISVSKSQGYTSVTPGAFVQKKTPYGNGNNSGGGGDYYSSGPAARRSSGGSGAESELRRLGKEPSLSDKGYAAAPETPTAVQVNQATSQDLSLPDDEMQYAGKNRSQSQGSKIFNRTVGRMGSRMLNSINSMPLPIKMPGGR